MGTIKLIDVYQQTIQNHDFVVAVVYSTKTKGFCRIYKKATKELFENLESLINEDIGLYIKPKLRTNGTTALDIEL